jgi:hypothetical protein
LPNVIIITLAAPNLAALFFICQVPLPLLLQAQNTVVCSNVINVENINSGKNISLGKNYIIWNNFPSDTLSGVLNESG